MSASSDYLNTVTRLTQQKGAAQADAQRQSGQIWGQTIANIGQTLPGQIQQAMQVRAQEQKQQQIESIFQQYGDDFEQSIPEVMKIDPELGMKLGERFNQAQKIAYDYKARQWEHEQKNRESVISLVAGAKDQDGYTQALVTAKWMGLDASQFPPEYNPQLVEGLNRSLMTAVQRADADKPTAPKLLNLTPGMKAFNEKGELVAENPYSMTPDQQADNARQGAAFEETQRHNRVMERKPTSSGGEPLVSVMGPDGKPVLIRRSQAEGKTPASNREVGRQVTSGDANRLKDYDSGLDDVAVIEGLLAPGTTGAKPAAGAAVPNFVTEWTGYGSDAKQTQATIDRVKQVIGKTLEEGVLRKEDEAKYAKILPTISDPYPVVQAKIAGLKAAITKAKQRQLEALEDANYDVTNFKARGSAPSKADPLGIR